MDISLLLGQATAVLTSALRTMTQPLRPEMRDGGVGFSNVASPIAARREAGLTSLVVLTTVSGPDGKGVR